MKKSKFLILGLIALLLAGGLALASCNSLCPGDCSAFGQTDTFGNLYFQKGKKCVWATCPINGKPTEKGQKVYCDCDRLSHVNSNN
jgi:hypothetical protein